MRAKQKSSHLQNLENESIFILREVVAEFKNPVMLYSVGKDSSVMVRLAQKAFYPGNFPFPLLHVDTGYKFPEMYQFRDEFVKRIGARLIVEKNEASIKKGIHPKIMGVDNCCAQLKTKALLDAISKHNFDAAFGGARRDEEKSRAKERIFSVRDVHGQWDPKNQRPELWNLYNTEITDNQTIRVFPLSNWTELDIWQYIKQEEIPIVPLYYSQSRKVVQQNNVLIPVEEYNKVSPQNKISDQNSKIKTLECRFRSLGCIPCTGAIESKVANIDDIIKDVSNAKRSERENRVIDLTSDSSMEQKKREGYF
jgi:sulfate adenylyltransferase subunit 2